MYAVICGEKIKRDIPFVQIGNFYISFTDTTSQLCSYCKCRKVNSVNEVVGMIKFAKVYLKGDIRIIDINKPILSYASDSTATETDEYVIEESGEEEGDCTVIESKKSHDVLFILQ